MRTNDRGWLAGGVSERLVTLLCAGILTGSLTACARISSFFSPQPPTITPAPQAQVVTTPTPVANATSSHHRHRKKPSPGKRRPENPEIAGTKGGASPSAKPSPESIHEDSRLTLDNDDATMHRANRLISETDQKLALIDVRTIAGGDADTYRQASGLATQAHQAADRHDYAAACGLAEKAALLAQKLEPSSPPPRRAALGK